MGDGQSHESDVAQAEERLPESVPETAFADGTVSTAASAIASVARPAHVKGSASPPAAPQRPRRRIRASEALALQRTAGNAATVRLLLRDKQRPTAAQQPLMPTKFGDEPWIERPSDRPMPPIRSELARGPLSSGNGSAGSSGATPAGTPAGTTGSSAD
jgi:hypothetical protein